MQEIIINLCRHDVRLMWSKYLCNFIDYDRIIMQVCKSRGGEETERAGGKIIAAQWAERTGRE